MTDSRESNVGDTAAIEQHEEYVHYTAVHSALEEYLDREIGGSLVGVRYPDEDAAKGVVKFVFAEATADD